MDTFRRILKLPDPRESLPMSSTAVMDCDDEKGRQELSPRGPSSILPLNSFIKDSVDNIDQDFQAANLPEGKYIIAPPPMLNGIRWDNLVINTRSILFTSPLRLLWANFPYQFLRNWSIKRGKSSTPYFATTLENV